MSCPSLERLAEWFLGASDEEESNRVEEHIFSCDRCADRATRMEALVQRLRTALPPVLTPERRKSLEEGARELPVTAVSPGTSATLLFEKGSEIGFWLMQQDLSGVERVDCQLLAEDGSPLFSLPDVPFDAERHEIVLACHVHYRLTGPADMVARVTSVDAAGERRTTEYRLMHRYSDL